MVNEVVFGGEKVENAGRTPSVVVGPTVETVQRVGAPATVRTRSLLVRMCLDDRKRRREAFGSHRFLAKRAFAVGRCRVGTALGVQRRLDGVEIDVEAVFPDNGFSPSLVVFEPPCSKHTNNINYILEQ